MADKELLDRLDRLHEKNMNRLILKEIAALPEEVRGEYPIRSRQARALGNLGELRKAREILEAAREEGKEDPLWWYRMGRCLFGLDRFREAAPCFSRALELDPGDRDSKYFIALCKDTGNKSGNRAGKGNKY